ncbi:hypothetical protein BCE75_11172 [Isoptericola sp. CG 20/1183]|uniref:Alpha/beta hydrolase family protein n=1 Tax=Isoptericola halotolerans TaxID=300560 RepID=A0ABX5ELK2_9MICO|nr:MULTISPECIES: hypothetical protein [Isoptericola]PRZ04151.1 hypothetical protein BCE75_11172 [Isoptericola sp. CG 20/1183]PRZ10024.1 hypothetical protein BCL65_101162 [Isoptericola halotolerans]
MTRLVLLHGRDTGGRDPEALEAVWLETLHRGLATAGSSLRVADGDATFVYYGDTLAGLVDGPTGPPVTTHGLGRQEDGELRFVLDVAREVLAAAGAPPEAGAAVGPDDGADVRAEGAVTDALAEALARVLAAIDRFVPGLSGAAVLLFARDVHRYLVDPRVRAAIDDGVADALVGDEPAVVVAHSFGSVVAYEVLRSAAAAGAQVPLLLTLGSPLAIRAVRDALRTAGPLTWPEPVDRWVAVRDPADLLALHDLDAVRFPLAGAREVEILLVDNAAPGHHAAAAVVDGRAVGYLATAAVGGLIDATIGA